MQLFLNKNPIYRCFVPKKQQLATMESANFYYVYFYVPLSNSNRTILELSPPFSCLNWEINQHNIYTQQYMDAIPTPPPGYTFSIVQKQQQRLFFENMLCTKEQQLWTSMDFYKASIVAVCTYFREEIQLSPEIFLSFSLKLFLVY